MASRGGDIADVELERFEATERPAGQARHDVEAVAFVDDLGDVGSTERDAIEDVQPAAARQLAMPAGRGPDPGNGQAEDRDEGIGVPGTARGESRKFAIEPVVDLEGGQ